MAFEKEYESLDEEQAKKTGLKQVSSQKSIFDNLPKKPSKEDFDKKVKNIEGKSSGYKVLLADLANQFLKLLNDKTLKENKSIFAAEIERELLSKMINLGVELNNDQNEPKDGMGSMSWITLLFKICLIQRDRINSLEYNLFQIDKKIELAIAKALDAKK